VWVDLATSDLDGAMRFYEGLLGWRSDASDTPMGRYIVARIDAGEVGGMMAQPSLDAGIPSAWTVIVGDDHLDATLARAEELGGTVLQPPMPIPGGARIAVVADPAGAVLALMEAPAAPTGMAWGEPGAVCWVECLTRDPGKSLDFYEQLFGWKAEEGPGGYIVLSSDGERVGGLMAMPPSVPAEAPSHWLVYFAADVAAACARARELGGDVLEPPHAISEGRFAVLADPAGAVFCVFEGSTS
jgi:predicted enzyme related to lactoylglutathione lyase